MLMEKTETLQQLENKLRSSIITDDDEFRFNRLNEKYKSWLGEIIRYYHLEDMPEIIETLKSILRVSQIKEYFLEKEIIASLDKALKRSSN